LRSFDIVPRRLVGLDRVIVGAEIRSGLDLVAELGLEVGQLLGRDVVVESSSPASKRFMAVERSSVGNVVDDVELDVRRVMELRVLDQSDVIVRDEFLQREGAVRDQIARLDEVVAEFLDRLALFTG
jgi:hypothetical protein